jgi:hypothetical protein
MDNFYAPTVAENLATQAPLQGANMFAGARSLGDLMAQQSQIKNALDAQKNANAMAPSQQAISQNQAANAPAVSAAGLEQSAATTANTRENTSATAAGLVSPAAANSMVQTMLHSNSVFRTMPHADQETILASVKTQYDPEDDSLTKAVRVQDVDAFSKNLVADFGAAGATKQMQEFQNKVTSTFTSRFGQGGKLVMAGQNLSNNLKVLGGAATVTKNDIQNAVTVYNTAAGAGGQGIISYESLYADVKSKLGYFSGMTSQGTSDAMKQDLIGKMTNLKAQLRSQLTSLFSSFSLDVGATGPGLAAFQQKQTQLMAEFDGGADVLDKGNEPAAGAKAAPSGWSVVR